MEGVLRIRWSMFLINTYLFLAEKLLNGSSLYGEMKNLMARY